jgi:hypothetical protein
MVLPGLDQGEDGANLIRQGLEASRRRGGSVPGGLSQTDAMTPLTRA